MAALGGSTRKRTAAQAAAPPVSLIVDTDCGMDDLLALGCLASCGSIALVTTVKGLLPPGLGLRTVRGLLETLETAGAPKVVGGAASPLRRRAREPGWIKECLEAQLEWAKAWLPGCLKRAHVQEAVEDASLQALGEVLAGSADGGLDIVALGPLTNLAGWIVDPTACALLERKVRRVWVMGGTLDPAWGNVGPAEFNFALDPAAAARVLSSGLVGRLRVLGLDVCHGEDPRQEDFAWRVASASTGLLSSLQASSNEAMLYDPVVAYAALHDGRGFEFREACIKVDTATGELVGADPGTPGATKVKVAVDFPAREAYVAWLVELCSRQGAAEQEAGGDRKRRSAASPQ